jgi:hypothetical protein
MNITYFEFFCVINSIITFSALSFIVYKIKSINDDIYMQSKFITDLRKDIQEGEFELERTERALYEVIKENSAEINSYIDYQIRNKKDKKNKEK